MKKLLTCVLIAALLTISFCAGWLVTVHNLEIWEDRPARTVFVADMFGMEWVYDYSQTSTHVAR